MLKMYSWWSRVLVCALLLQSCAQCLEQRKSRENDAGFCAAGILNKQGLMPRLVEVDESFSESRRLVDLEIIRTIAYVVQHSAGVALDKTWSDWLKRRADESGRSEEDFIEDALVSEFGKIDWSLVRSRLPFYSKTMRISAQEFAGYYLKHRSAARRLAISIAAACKNGSYKFSESFFCDLNSDLEFEYRAFRSRMDTVENINAAESIVDKNEAIQMLYLTWSKYRSSRELYDQLNAHSKQLLFEMQYTYVTGRPFAVLRRSVRFYGIRIGLSELTIEELVDVLWAYRKELLPTFSLLGFSEETRIKLGVSTDTWLRFSDYMHNLAMCRSGDLSPDCLKFGWEPPKK